MRTDGGTPEITDHVYDAAGQRVRKVTEGKPSKESLPLGPKSGFIWAGSIFYREDSGDGSVVTLERRTNRMSWMVSSESPW